MNSWKTTIAGVGAILGAVALVLQGLGGDGTIDFAAAGTALMAGIGLLVARDNSASSEDVGTK